MAKTTRFLTALIAATLLTSACGDAGQTEIAELRERVAELEATTQTATTLLAAARREPIDVDVLPTLPSPTTAPIASTTTTTEAPIDPHRLRREQESRFFWALGLDGEELSMDFVGGGSLMRVEIVSTGYMFASSETTPDMSEALLRGVARANDIVFAIDLRVASDHLDGDLAQGWATRCASDTRLPTELLGYCVLTLVRDAVWERDPDPLPPTARLGEYNKQLGVWWCEAAVIAIDKGWSPETFADNFRSALASGRSVFPDIAAAVEEWDYFVDPFEDRPPRQAHLPYPAKPDDLPVEEFWYPYSLDEAAVHARLVEGQMTQYKCWSTDLREYPDIQNFFTAVAENLNT